MTCEDFPACGHEQGCCPDFDESGKQLNMVCTCGAKLPIDNPSSICDACLKDWDEEEEEFSEERDEPQDMTDVEADADTLKSAGYGTDEDYGGYEDRGDFFGDD